MHASCCEILPDIDIDECEEDDICGVNATCINTDGGYHCVYNSGFELKADKDSFSGKEERNEGEDKDMLCLIQQHLKH